MEYRLEGLAMLGMLILFLYAFLRKPKGILEKVENKEQEPGSNAYYYMSVIRDIDGKWKKFFFTENELKRLRKRASKNQNEG